MTSGSIENAARAAARIGTAGWSIPTDLAEDFSAPGTHLARYAQRLNCAEINSSFYRPHRPATYERWAASTPPDFRFSVKAPKTVTHEAKLAPATQLLEAFLHEARHLGEKLGPILFQLPPSLAFDPSIAGAFVNLLRDLYPTGSIAFEPRHLTWFSQESEDLLQRHHITRVLADPPRGMESSVFDLPPTWSANQTADLMYYRLHGSPRTYYSTYDEPLLETVAAQIRRQHASAEIWVIFDNTASGAAAHNALRLTSLSPENDLN